MSIILKADNISKQYRLGKVGTGTLGDDFKRWWYKVRGKEDPFLKIGGVNDRSAKAIGDYVWALRNINFEVKQGEILGIIGKNGAGKSTLLKLLSRVTAPTTGTIKTKGRIASLLEIGTGFHPELTGRENIFMNGAVLGMNRAEIKRKLDEIIEFSGCEMYIDTPVKRYSSGMTVRLGFAVAAHLEPEILVVDEVLAVGDAEFQKKALGKMDSLSKGEGRTVLFVSHNMASIKNLCSRVIVLGNGESVFEGNTYEGVDHYLKKKNLNIQQDGLITEVNRRENTSKEIELSKITISNDEISVRDSLVFNIEISQNLMHKKIIFMGTICSMDDTRIGSFFSNELVLNEDTTSIQLQIENHNLTLGSYYLNFSVGTGSPTIGNVLEYDHAYEAINFSVVKLRDDYKHIVKWKKNWGNLYFDSVIKQQ